MKRPAWATVIGIIMITLGGYSVLNDIKAINFPSNLAEKRSILQNEMQTSDTLAAVSNDSLELSQGDSKRFKHIQFDQAKNVLDIPETTLTWIVRFGYIGLFISMIYMIAGIFLLRPKNLSIKLSYAALILSIAFSATKTMVLTSTGLSSGPIVLTMGATQLFSIIIDIVLLSVIYSAEDKDAFT